MGNQPSNNQTVQPPAVQEKPRSQVEPKAPVQVSRPMNIGVSASPHKAEWDDDERVRPVISQSAPVRSNRNHIPIPVRPNLRPSLPNVFDLPPEMELPPPSLSESTLGVMSAGSLAKSVPLSRSLLQYAMSCPPDLPLAMQARGTHERARKTSILDLVYQPPVLGDEGAVAMEDDGDKEPDSDEELPFR
jgi:hypothetical protein